MFKNLLKLPLNPLLRYQPLFVGVKRLAGHSKWANIRHVKGAKDAQRSILFTKISRQMRVAVQEGGSADPKLNQKLDQVIEQAKRANMPAATLSSVLKSCQQDKSNSKPFLIEIKGPGSCIILCEVFTSNLHLLRQTMATILRKNGSKFGDGGGQHFFEQKGLIETAPITKKTGSTVEEMLEVATEHAIESGAEDVRFSEVDENLLQFICGATNLKTVANNLEEQFQYKIEGASVEFIPLKVQQLSDDELKVCANLYEKLEQLPDIVRLSDNIA